MIHLGRLKDFLMLSILAPILISVSGLGLSAHADDTAIPLNDSLPNTRWSGKFGTNLGPLKAHGNITVQFLNDHTSDGKLQYTFAVKGGGVLGAIVGPFDHPCPFKPRTLSITQRSDGGGYEGVINAWLCQKSQAAQDAKDKAGAKPFQIPVDKIEVSPDGKTLTIVATIATRKVIYTLEKPPVPGQGVSPDTAAAPQPATTRRTGK